MSEYLSTRGMNFEFPADYGSRTIVAEGNEEELVELLRDAAAHGIGDAERRCVELMADMCDGHGAERVCELVESMVKAK